ncbi:chorismate mutase [Lactococcus protaetiae]|uniref:Chorismate mutase n=1 Tax=Lactococcus protaetiae TaxID=2592653 RepID=A0A514Z6B8_9LACT|nr:chorismate mutase [Lactococcus protaetiae]QDK70126.1 chorismate mutase [Lactococcus protaetiae]
MNLKDLRCEIDQIDEQITQLLEQRMNLVLDIAKTKKIQKIEVVDLSREQLVLDRIAQKVQNPEYRSTIVNTYQDIMKNSRAYQQDFLKENKKTD